MQLLNLAACQRAGSKPKLLDTWGLTIQFFLLPLLAFAWGNSPRGHSWDVSQSTGWHLV